MIVEPRRKNKINKIKASGKENIREMKLKTLSNNKESEWCRKNNGIENEELANSNKDPKRKKNISKNIK